MYPPLQEGFRKEIQLLQACRHEHVVGFRGACLDAPGHLLMILELMRNGDLRTALTADADGVLRWYRRWAPLLFGATTPINAGHAAALPLRTSYTSDDIRFQISMGPYPLTFGPYPYCRGTDANGQRQPGLGKQIALDVARGLDFLHAQHIVHLDMKTPNGAHDCSACFAVYARAATCGSGVVQGMASCMPRCPLLCREMNSRCLIILLLARSASPRSRNDEWLLRVRSAAGGGQHRQDCGRGTGALHAQRLPQQPGRCGHLCLGGGRLQPSRIVQQGTLGSCSRRNRIVWKAACLLQSIRAGSASVVCSAVQAPEVLMGDQCSSKVDVYG